MSPAKNKSYSYLIPADQNGDKSQTSFRLFDQVMFWDAENNIGMNKDLDSILATMGAMFYQIINQQHNSKELTAQAHKHA